MAQDLRWGFLGNARHAQEAILPALAVAGAGSAVAIASRDAAGAAATANRFGIHAVHTSYQALIDDPIVDAIYIGLPNSMHAEWIRKAIEAGKHVLCEKPITLSAAELDGLPAAAHANGVLVAEALMVWSHPRMHRLRTLIRAGKIGDVRAVQGRFGFMSRDGSNIRNIAALGGGGLLDLGMYLVSTARWVFNDEPRRALCILDRDAKFGTDVLATFLLEFPKGHGSFVCSTQMGLNQRFIALGTRGHIEIETPFTPSATLPTRLLVASSVEESNQLSEEIEVIPAVDQYALELRDFADAVAGSRPPAVSLESSIANMRVLDALAASAGSGAWEVVKSNGNKQP